VNSGSLQQRLPPRPSSVAEARSAVRSLLTNAGREDLLDAAVLLVSEVVTNALLHAGTDIDLAARLDDEGLLVEVGDGSPNLPARRRYATTSGTGRGLLMLDSMVDDWGAAARDGGKVVWFRLSGAADHPRRRSSDSLAHAENGRVDRRGETIPVELRDMPLLLHAAWQEHSEALLREYLLVNLSENDMESIQRHAEATDAIAVLEEHVPRPEVTFEADEVMSDAVEPRVSAARVQVPVPAASVKHFDTLDRAVQEALDLSREGLVLTPPTPPEVQAFRDWIVRQVRGQAGGAEPEAWRVPEALPAHEHPLMQWDPRTVLDAPTGVIAADPTSRILAASREAADLLGYPQDELVGMRLVSVMPERYRQAHVAGFTMYLLVGRKPLMERTVTVPALRRDGTEVQVDLTVHVPEPLAGQTVFLADFRPAAS
jgi:PAS domain S-box-containing protein